MSEDNRNENEEPARVIPVTEEALEVHKRQHRTGGVKVHKEVRQRQVEIDEPLQVTQVDVRRVPVQRFVERAEGTRQEGDTTIIPVYEEVLVTEKRLQLKEEVHITRRQVTRHADETVTLRTEEAVVSRDEESGSDKEHQPTKR